MAENRNSSGRTPKRYLPKEAFPAGGEGEPLFLVHDAHVPGGGVPPTVRTGDPNYYHSYFENEYGEQAIFRYNRTTGEAAVVLGDAGWDLPCVVRDGFAEHLILGKTEQHWLIASFAAATGRPIEEVTRAATREAARVALHRDHGVADRGGGARTAGAAKVTPHASRGGALRRHTGALDSGACRGCSGATARMVGRACDTWLPHPRPALRMGDASAA